MRTLHEVLQEAERRKVAVGHFNISDLVALQAVVASAHEQSVPVLVGVSEGERQFMGVRQVAALVKSIRDEYGYPVFLNADHTHSLAKAEEAAKAGFDEVLVDGSTLPFEENAKQTHRAVEAIKSINPSILVEGEVGYIGTSSEFSRKLLKGLALLRHLRRRSSLLMPQVSTCWPRRSATCTGFFGAWSVETPQSGWTSKGLRPSKRQQEFF